MVESGTYPARSVRRGHFRLHDHVECEQVARELAEDLIYVSRASGAFALLRNTRMKSARERATQRNDERSVVRNSLKRLAPQAGFEPATLRLTAGCSTVELLRNSGRTDRFGPNLNSSESATPRAIRSSDRRGSPNAREGNRPSARHLSSI